MVWVEGTAETNSRMQRGERHLAKKLILWEIDREKTPGTQRSLAWASDLCGQWKGLGQVHQGVHRSQTPVTMWVEPWE